MSDLKSKEISEIISEIIFLLTEVRRRHLERARDLQRLPKNLNNNALIEDELGAASFYDITRSSIEVKSAGVKQ